MSLRRKLTTATLMVAPAVGLGACGGAPTHVDSVNLKPPPTSQEFLGAEAEALMKTQGWIDVFAQGYQKASNQHVSEDNPHWEEEYGKVVATLKSIKRRLESYPGGGRRDDLLQKTVAQLAVVMTIRDERGDNHFGSTTLSAEEVKEIRGYQNAVPNFEAIYAKALKGPDKGR